MKCAIYLDEGGHPCVAEAHPDYDLLIDEFVKAVIPPGAHYRVVEIDQMPNGSARDLWIEDKLKG